MADIVLIAEGTYREGLNNIGDVVEVQEDGIITGGVGYANFTVINIPGTKAEVEAILNSKIPAQKRCFRTNTAAGVWGDEPPEEAEFWFDTTTREWKKIESYPKYPRRLILTQEAENAIKDAALSDTTRLAYLNNIAVANVMEVAENQVVTSIIEKEVAEVTKG